MLKSTEFYFFFIGKCTNFQNQFWGRFMRRNGLGTIVNEEDFKKKVS